MHTTSMSATTRRIWIFFPGKSRCSGARATIRISIYRRQRQWWRSKSQLRLQLRLWHLRSITARSLFAAVHFGPTQASPRQVLRTLTQRRIPRIRQKKWSADQFQANHRRSLQHLSADGNDPGSVGGSRSETDRRARVWIYNPGAYQLNTRMAPNSASPDVTAVRRLTTHCTLLGEKLGRTSARSFSPPAASTPAASWSSNAMCRQTSSATTSTSTFGDRRAPIQGGDPPIVAVDPEGNGQ